MHFIEHQRSTKAEAACKVVEYILFLLALGFMHWLIHGWIHWMLQPDPAFDLLMMIVMTVAEAALILWAALYVYRNWVCEGAFRFRLDEQVIECQSPLEQYAASFSLPTAKVAFIGQTRFDFRAPQYWIEDLDGKRYWLTSRYGNPIFRILGTLRNVRSDIEFVIERGESQWFDGILAGR